MVPSAFDPIVLPNGSKLKNRIVKAAMEENMADVVSYNQPGPSLHNLYRKWAEGGAGLILSGEVIINAKALASPGDLLLARDGPVLDRAAWHTLAEYGQRNGAQFWLQINHPGRMVKKETGCPAYAPSPIAVDLGRFSGIFDKPLQMTDEHIREVINDFIWTAKEAEALGFGGVEVHAAHGYLISAFLSPLTNRRTDEWGGSQEARAKLLFMVVDGIRRATSPKFGVGIKINTSDLQKGGFGPDDLLWVVEQLDDKGLDLIELSGGNAESPVMGGHRQVHLKESTRLREAYFLEAAQNIIKTARTPLVITGGITGRSSLDAVVASSDTVLAGIGTALGLIPDLPNRWARGEDPQPSLSTTWVLPFVIKYAARTAAVQFNLHMHGRGWWTWHGIWPVFAVLFSLRNEQQQMRSYKAWLKEWSQDSN